MEDNITAAASAAPSVSAFLKQLRIDKSNHMEANGPVVLSPVSSTKSSTQRSYTGSVITATLENKSVWSRFHNFGTEMILTKQGRRMFPCCRFRLSGLDPNTKYMLVMDIVPLDDFKHKWNGQTWEPTVLGAPHVAGKMCVHPDSPALGMWWMENPVSFYKVKLTDSCLDQEGCLVLHPMQRYQPRLHVVPVGPDSEEDVALDGPNVQVFTFPKTEFYAVTSYQNPQITQLKIDCNPFAMAFREDRPSIRRLQEKLRLCSSGSPVSQSAVLSLASVANQRKENALKNGVSPQIQDNSKLLSTDNEGEQIITKMAYNDSGYQNNVSSCIDVDVEQCRGKSQLHKPVAPMDIKPSETQRPSQTTVLCSPMSNNKTVTKTPTDAINSQVSYACDDSPAESSTTAQRHQSQGTGDPNPVASFLPKAPVLHTSQVNKAAALRFGRKRFRRYRKARSRWWSNVKYAKPPPVITPPNCSLLPDLEDVDGMLFVSFTEKDALNIHVQNMEHVETPPLLSKTRNQLDNQEGEDVSLSTEERISKLESTLLLHLKQLKHRQVLHPLLQEVGMKLSLLDPALAIDLQYLGVRLPFPPPTHQENLTSFSEAAVSFVSRTGKTNDPTKIKGWREKFNTNAVQTAQEGVKKNSAFCSDMLDEYLENEAQQISERVAMLSTSSTCSLSYQLPSKSSSYVVTLDSLLKTRPAHSNKACRSPPNKVLPRAPFRSVPKNKRRGRHFAHSSKGQQLACSGVKESQGPHPRGVTGIPDGGGRHSKTSAKIQMQVMHLQDMEEEAFFNGQARTYITDARAKFSLSSLFTSAKSEKRTSLTKPHRNEEACVEDFCRLGCICDSLQREIRGPIHCRRVQCMFDCNCFKHKMLLLHPPKVTTVRRGRKRSLMAFSIDDPERGPRPPPASSITTLWKKRAEEQDPEPLFVPPLAPVLKTVSHLGHNGPRSASQTQEMMMPDEEKDPVYLYFESMMTCARVREYNSNPPPQIHMFPNKKDPQGAEKSNNSLFPPNLQKNSDMVQTGEPEPTKLLEIVSECNWEPHRNLVLSALFGHVNSNQFAEPLSVSTYKVQLLSTTLKRGNTCSTLIYKVCVSWAEDKNKKDDSKLKGKRAKTNTHSNKMDTQHKKKAKKGTATFSKRRSVLNTPQKKAPKPYRQRPSRLLPLLTRGASSGYLKADKKKPAGPAFGLIKVNGKIYNKAKLLLGQMGALHSANRFAAFVTGRLQIKPQPQYGTNKAPAKLQRASKRTALSSGVHNLPPASNPKHNPASKKARRSNPTALKAPSELMDHKTSTTSVCAPPLGTQPCLLVTPSIPAAVPLADTSPAATLPPGQPVVLKQIPGLFGSNYLCQYNGQMIQLVPITPAPTVQPAASSSSEGIIPVVIRSATEDTKSLQKPLKSTPLPRSKRAAKALPLIVPKILSLSGASGMYIANGTPAFKPQSSFPGKTSTFSFRICPPTTDDKPVESEEGSKPGGSLVGTPTTLILPGGFTLIKLPHAAPTVLSNVTSTASVSNESTNDKCAENSTLQSCPPSSEQRCPPSESKSSGLLQKSDCNPLQAEGALKSENGLVDESDDKSNIATSGKYEWTPYKTDMEFKNDIEDHEMECDGMDEWPSNGAERVLWIDDDSSDEEEDGNFNKKMNNNPIKGPARPDVKIEAGIDVGSSGSNKCLQEGKLPEKEMKTSESRNTNGNSLTLETKSRNNCSYAAEPKQHMESRLQNKELETVSDNSLVCVKKEPQDELIQAVSFGPPNINKQVMQQENGSSVFIKIEPYNEPAESGMVANQSDIREQDCVGVNSFFSKEAGNCPAQRQKFTSHVDTGEQDLGKESKSRVFIKVEPIGDLPETDNGQDINSDNTLSVTKKKDSSNSETLSNQPDLSKQRLNSFENSLQIPQNKKLGNGLVQIQSHSTSPIITDSQKYAKDSSINVKSDVPCQLFTGETPLIHTPSTAHFPDKSSIRKRQKTSPPQHTLDKSFSKNKRLQHKSDYNTRMSGVAKHAQREDAQINCKRKNVNKFKQAKWEFSPHKRNNLDTGKTSKSDDPKDKSESKKGAGSSEEDSSDVSEFISDNEAEDSTDVSSEEGDTIDIESFEENEEKITIFRMKAEASQNQQTAVPLIRGKRRHKRCISENTEHELAKRINHTEKERVRRGEMLQSYASLKKVLNIGEKIRLCKHDILNQAQLMIRALENRGRSLEERKRALLQRQSAYINMIAQLSGKTEDMDKKMFEENLDQKKDEDIQTMVMPSLKPQINSRRLDKEGNQLPPRLGLWRSANYIRKRSKKSYKQPSITTTESALDLRTGAHSLTPCSKLSSLRHAGKELFSLPKIVLQSFGKNGSGVNLRNAAGSPPPSDPQALKSDESSPVITSDPQDREEGVERDDSTMICREEENVSVSEYSNKENPGSSPPVYKHNDKKKVPALEIDKQKSVGLMKRRKKLQSDVVREKPLSTTDSLGVRQLRNRSLAISEITKRSRRRKRI